MGNLRIYALAVALGITTVVFFENCSPFKAAGFKDREALLAAKLFYPASVEGANPEAGASNNSAGTDPATGAPGAPQAESPGIVQHVDAVCTSDGTARMGGNIISSERVTALVKNEGGQTSCEINDPRIKNDLINEHKIYLGDLMKQCSPLIPGQYTIELHGPKTGNLLTLETSTGLSSRMMQGLFCNGLFGVSSKCSKELMAGYMRLYEGTPVPYPIEYSAGAQRPASNEGAAVLMNQQEVALGQTANCDFSTSPLIVQLRRDGREPQKIVLTAPTDGVRFDIMGERSYPTPHAPRQISWLSPQTVAGNFYIVLPDRDGQVRGINEMFGDNTRGPDGGFAKNGYEALGKWDANRDGLISNADEVFRRLRFWGDFDGDGVATVNELYPPEQLGIEHIDLRFDPDYKEVDRWGNEIRMKSTVRTTDGQDHIMYDLWFRIVD